MLCALLSTDVLADTAYTGMHNISPQQFVDDMGVGWNLGNTLDAVMPDETGWGNPYTTKPMIDQIAQRGFKTMRLPVTWQKHMGGAPNYIIERAWLDRVEEVANYALTNNMYVIINIHHDDDWIIPTYAKKDAVIDQLKKVWTQIADRFKDYGDHVIFETINEPRLKDSPEEWQGGTAEGREVVNAFQKACVDAIRATGGNNSTRKLMVSTYAAAGYPHTMDAFVMPNNDPNTIVSLHNYFPFEFALGKQKEWGGEADIAALDGDFDNIYNKFVANGYAVVIGEWCATDNDNLEARVKYADHFARGLLARGMCPVWWDIGAQDGSGLLDRNTLNWFYPEIADAIIKAQNSNGQDNNTDNSTDNNLDPDNQKQDQCDYTQECKNIYGNSATDCLNSKSDQSICMCGNQPCR